MYEHLPACLIAIVADYAYTSFAHAFALANHKRKFALALRCISATQRCGNHNRLYLAQVYDSLEQLGTPYPAC